MLNLRNASRGVVALARAALNRAITGLMRLICVFIARIAGAIKSVLVFDEFGIGRAEAALSRGETAFRYAAGIN